MAINQALEVGFDFIEPRARAILSGEMKEQMAMDDVGVRLALATPGPSGGMPRRSRNLLRPSRTLAKRLPSGSSKAIVPDQWSVRWATKGRPIDFANLTASMRFVACWIDIVVECHEIDSDHAALAV